MYVPDKIHVCMFPKIRVFVSFSELSIVLTCKSAQICCRAENICLHLEVRNVLKRWRPAPFLGKFPFLASLGKLA